MENSDIISRLLTVCQTMHESLKVLSDTIVMLEARITKLEDSDEKESKTK